MFVQLEAEPGWCKTAPDWMIAVFRPLLGVSGEEDDVGLRTSGLIRYLGAELLPLLLLLLLLLPLLLLPLLSLRGDPLRGIPEA